MLPDFLPETRAIREGTWRVAPIPADLQDRRVEITGPTDRKMVINALNSGARVFMTDFEDSNSPTWDNMVRGPDQSHGPLERRHRLQRSAIPASTMCSASSPRCSSCGRAAGICRKTICAIDGQPMSGALFDFGLYFFHNAKAALRQNSGPYFYLPKMESHREARLWNDVFILAQSALGLPLGTIKATVLIETLPAAFEMDEILYRTARSYGRAQLRALGLYLLLHQDLRHTTGTSSCRTARRW